MFGSRSYVAVASDERGTTYAVVNRPAQQKWMFLLLTVVLACLIAFFIGKNSIEPNMKWWLEQSDIDPITDKIDENDGLPFIETGEIVSKGADAEEGEDVKVAKGPNELLGMKDELEKEETQLAEDAAEEEPQEEVDAAVSDKVAGNLSTEGELGEHGEDERELPLTSITSTADLVKSPFSAAQLQSRCPLWSAKFAARYEKTCGYWIKLFDEWEKKTADTNRKEVAYYCSVQKECHGWGDRVAGMQAAFLRAVDLNQPFKIGHEHLSSMFHPCLFGKKQATNWANNSFHLRSDACQFTNSGRCAAWGAKTCNTGLQLVTVNSDRVCINRRHCSILLQNFPKLSAAGVLGCISRAMFEPSESFFNEYKFPFKFEGKTTMMTLGEIQQLMSKYYVIAVQMRLGDNAAFRSRQRMAAFEHEQKKYLRPFRCASIVESHVSGASHLASGQEEYEDFDGNKPLTVKGKPVLWFIATDTYVYKQLVDKTFGNKIISFDIRPEHIGLTGRGKQDLAKEIAEWYSLGLADKLIVNKIGLDSSDIFHGRVSGYAKSSWVYHLKHMVYDAGTCRLYSIPFEGTWADIQMKGCGRSTLYFGRTKFKQNHMLPLKKQNVTFPQYYIRNGQVVSDHLTDSSDPHDVTLGTGSQGTENPGPADHTEDPDE